jgi:hypothetical protein
MSATPRGLALSANPFGAFEKEVKNESVGFRS